MKRIHDVLFPELGMEVKLIQLMGGGKEFDWMKNPAGMVELAKRADGIGPGMNMVVLKGSKVGDLKISNLVKDAHAAGLKVHPYTLRKDGKSLPEYAKDFDDLVDIFYRQIGVDGAFTDFPDLVVKALSKE
ncbi:MAG: hypothetical protein L3J39_00340 [Verrucomicrobiales bacterium]|nr:hypothetical protein [Verrucomicrobiales bacterium]